MLNSLKKFGGKLARLSNNQNMQKSQTDLQKKVHEQKLNLGEYFGAIIAGYLLKRFRRLIKFPLLDAGCGGGDVIKKLRQLYPQYLEQIIGIDLVAVPELNVIQGDIKKMPFEDEKFKTIICTEVLEHLDDETLEKTLGEFKRVLTNDGYLICTFPYDEKLERNTFICPHCNKSFHRYGHVQSWHSEESIREMFESAGFKIKELDILPLGAVAKFPPLRLFKLLLNKLDNPPGLRKRAVVVITK